MSSGTRRARGADVERSASDRRAFGAAALRDPIRATYVIAERYASGGIT
jgi:hypothetical protein